MSPRDLGSPLSSLYSIPGGQARLFEHGMTVKADGSSDSDELTVFFDFPGIGRPSIVTGDSTRAPVFEVEAIHFSLLKPLSSILLPIYGPLIQKALTGHLGLVPTGKRVNVDIGTLRTIGTVGIMQGIEATGTTGTIGTVENIDTSAPTGSPLDPSRPSRPISLIIGDTTFVRENQGWLSSNVYGVPVTALGLEERQLYDVAIRGEGNHWRIVAPHAVYHRRNWSDFGIAHITDIHVARRIDLFRGILREAGRQRGANSLINWNDRFRGFIKFANYLHRNGQLDLILATGDLYDYIYEDDDHPSGGGNAKFFREIILGRVPGPDFPDVEELLVPIFTVPGNHDYRKHPYHLIFDLNIAGKDLGDRFRLFSGYNMLNEDAKLVTIRYLKLLHPGLENLAFGGFEDDTVLNLSGEAAARMVEVDPNLEAYKRFITNKLSYVIWLGPHKIAMLDSGPDVGVLTDVLDGLRAWLSMLSEDEETFASGSPNTEGVSQAVRDLVSDALLNTPQDGLFIVGIHAPLFNFNQNASPYFFRETQRPQQPTQAHGFLARQKIVRAHIGDSTSPEQQVEKAFPLWFRSEDDNRRGAPSYIKRGDSQQFLDFSISRGQADNLIRIFAGIGATRPADLVLAGHVHTHKEFKVRKDLSDPNDVNFFMDFYTQNPKSYYPSRFTTSLEFGPGLDPLAQDIKARSDVTSLHVTLSAEPDASPSPAPESAPHNFRLQIPPNPNPLNSAVDERAWWADHRPLFLLTGPLGPLDHPEATFTGFRLIQVKNNIIDRIHFYSTPALEANNYEGGTIVNAPTTDSFT